MSGGDAFISASKRWSKFEEKTGPLCVLIHEVAKHFDKSDAHNDTLKRKNLQQLQKSVQQLVNLENVANARRDACDRTAEKVKSNLDENAAEIFAGESAGAVQIAYRKRVNNDNRVKEISQLLGGDTGEEDEVQAVGENFHQTTCPILATPLTNPLKNDACGHVYSYQGSLQLLIQRINGTGRFESLDELPAGTSAKCPVAGCNKSFGPKTLKRDYAAEHSQRLRTATARSNEDDDDEAINMVE